MLLPVSGHTNDAKWHSTILFNKTNLSYSVIYLSLSVFQVCFARSPKIYNFTSNIYIYTLKFGKMYLKFNRICIALCAKKKTIIFIIWLLFKSYNVKTFVRFSTYYMLCSILCFISYIVLYNPNWIYSIQKKNGSYISYIKYTFTVTFTSLILTLVH